MVGAPGASSLMIVPVPWAFSSVAFDGADRLTKKVSSGSSWVSPLTSTVIGFCVSPGTKVNVPLAG